MVTVRSRAARATSFIHPALLGFLVLAGNLACSPEEPVIPQEPPEDSRFIRFVEDDPAEDRLETAIVAYARKGGPRVDLVAAVHLADPAYYRTLDERFAGYDRVLYELIAEEGAVPGTKARDREDDSLLSLFQRGLCRSMDLVFQLDGIDYRRENFVHADLTPREFARIWKEKGESIWKIIFRVLAVQMEALAEGKTGAFTPEAVLAAMASADRTAGMKRLLAREFENVETLIAGLEPDGTESVILGARNRACIEVLEEVIDDGHKRIAIFYGGAHMPDFEKRLMQGLGFTRLDEEWIPAWTIRK